MLPLVEKLRMLYSATITDLLVIKLQLLAKFTVGNHFCVLVFSPKVCRFRIL